MQIIGVAAVLVGLVCLLALALWLITVALFFIAALHEARDFRHFQADLAIMDRWLCHDFPIVKDITVYLAKPEERTPISQFRDDLRGKYGERKP
jgi:hypothetical protein